MTVRRALVALGVSVFYGLVALLVGGASVAQCLGMNNGECIAAWYASMSPIERAIHDAPGWVVPVAIFVGLWALTLIGALVARRIWSRPR